MMDLYWDGPDTAVVSTTRSIKAEITASFGLSVKQITAGVGFSVSNEYSVTFSSTTPVPANTTLNVKVCKTYQK